MKTSLVKAFEAQINREFYSWYFYLAMVNYLEGLGLQGFGKWMRLQADEEHMHAMKLFGYVQDRGDSVKLADITAPTGTYSSVEEVFEKVLKHEQGVSENINGLYEAANKDQDHAAMTFLQWFLSEQVEEEKTVGDLLAKIKMVGSDKAGLLFLDKEMGARQATGE